MTCAKCGLENVKNGSPCASASASLKAEPNANSPISEDFLLGSTKLGLERIRARLLDLTKRNRLLNFRHTHRSSLAIVGILPDILFGTLIEGGSVTFKPVPEPNASGQKPKVVDHARQVGLPTSVDLPEPASLPVVRGSRAGQVQTLHYPDDLEAILRRISYTARTAIEESGTKMLHLIFGFLEWFESESSDQPHLAPLLLVPVTIENGRADRASGTFTYEIAYSSADQIEENLSLREKLKRDFGLDMPELSDEETPESYFLKFRDIVSARPRWRLRRRVTLGFVYFGKLLMFRDLDPKNWPKETNILEHPRLRDFFEGSKLPESSFAEEYTIDAPDQPIRVPPLIHDADSSQHSALIDALEGKNLVIEGPPGTGKSQTITNLIALALANAKTVLFVSEKLAALEVVRRRLDQAGLGLFCLELHSHKTDKRKLLNELEERLAARGSFREPKDLAKKRTLLQRARQQLNEYADLIDMPFSELGTGFDVIWRREWLRQALAFDSGLVEGIRLDRNRNTRLVDFESDCQILDVYGGQLTELRKRFPDINNHPWRHVSNAALSYLGAQELCGKLEEIRSCARELRGAIADMASMTGVAIEVCESLEQVATLVGKANQIPDVQHTTPMPVLRAAAIPSSEKELLSFIRDVTSWKAVRAQLVQKFPNIANDRDPATVEPLRLVCDKTVELGLGNFDRALLTTIATECKSLRAIMNSSSVLDRESLAASLATLESAPILSRLFNSAYRVVKRAFKETFVAPNRPRRKDMMKVLRDALAFVDKLEADAGFAARHRAPLSYDDLNTPIDTRRSIVLSFEHFGVGEAQTARGVLAGICEFSANCKVASAIANRHVVRELIGAHFQGVDTNLEVISDALNTIAAIRRANLPKAIEAWLLQSDIDVRLSLLRDHLAKLGRHLRALDEALSRFSELGHIDPQEWWGPKPWTLAMLERVAEAALGEADTLSSWLAFQRAASGVKSAKLNEITKLADSKSIAVADLVAAYTYVLYNTLAQELTRERPQLFRFSGLQQEAVRERFVQFDKDLIELNRQSAALRASRRLVPPGIRCDPVGQWTELELIEQEIAKKKGHIPIRQLVRRAGSGLQALKPCFMMGPLSVAQYIAPGQLNFDLVVMDEASQLKPEDALGAIARGRQLVVVGDTKQLPPSTFFERKLDLEPDEESAEDASSVEERESILDVASALYQPVRQLRWHYRSRHDSLIAFSNAEFYRNGLLVFPSPAQKGTLDGIQFRHVANGVYEAGHARWNRPEAERIVNQVVHHMHLSPELSLGVVALNYQQRELIDELLTERIRNDEIAQLFIERHKEASEPFFIKNLEHVQGDERDAIFISVTYGRDSNGNLCQRFGPINQEKGPRRLNVLFTRARRRVVVFSSIDPDEIRTAPSSPRGVAVLKAYLNYAKTGRLDTEGYTELQAANDFEIAVSSALRGRGFECVPQVGVAGFFIDIAVRHPEKPGAFILGIQCDGASYHSAKAARDRYRLQQTILENKGWNIHGIWSTDWFRDRRLEIEKIVERIQEISASERRETVRASRSAKTCRPGDSGCGPAESLRR
jgi:very-short-patch-repair endonuclease